MNWIQLLSAEPWVGRAGSTLLHFVWQGAFVALVYAIARRSPALAGRPHARYILACAALLLMAAAPLLTWIWLRPAAASSVAASFAAPLSAAASPSVRDVPATAAAEVSLAAPPSSLPWVVAAGPPAPRRANGSSPSIRYGPASPSRARSACWSHPPRRPRPSWDGSVPSCSSL